MSKSPIKDYSRLLGQSRTAKKDENVAPYRYYKYETSDRIVDDIRTKLDLSLKHNAKLLDQNSQLSELVSQLRHQVRSQRDHIELLGKSGDNQLNTAQLERIKLLEELEIKQNGHECELRRLLDEVSTLHKEKNDLEIVKNRQFETFKLEHEKNTATYIRNLKESQQNSKELYETQIQKLKTVIEDLRHQYDSSITERRLETNRLTENIKSLEGEIAHLKHLNQLEIQQLKKTFDNQIHQEKRSLERQRQVENSNFTVAIKRLKNDIMDKNQQIDALSRKLSNNEEMHSVELEHLKREKESLLSDLNTTEVHHANKMAKEKAKLKEIGQQELQNVLNLNQTFIDELRSEINKLRNLLDCKNSQIRRIYEENTSLKKTLNAQITSLTSANEGLRSRQREIEREHLEDFEAFKIKIAQLVDSNISSLNSYYQNEISLLLTNISSLEKINKQNKDRLYDALQDNDELRKNFEIDLSKQKARVQDLKIKLAALSLEHKEHVTSIGTKMELTSMTLVRETEQKNKSQVFFEEEKKKFHSLSNSKDREISDLMDNMRKMKELHEADIKALRNEKKEMREHLQMAEDKVEELKKSYEEQLNRREEKYRAEHSKEAEDKAAQELKELYETNEKIENQNIKLQKQVEHLVRENRSIAQQLGLRKGHIETLQLESCAAIEDEKSKLKIMMGNSELSLKEYYEDKIKSREKDISHLQAVLAGKEQDIRDLIVKYNGLEKRLEMLLESQEKVRDFEEKVKNLGLDDNLVKNMAELFCRK